MLILASASPRRKELLKKLWPDFKIVVPNVDEKALRLPPEDLAKEESRLKAYAVAASYPDDEILSCDTIVVLDGKILEKPIDEEDAFRMLRLESGKRQVVLSGWTYLGKGKEITRTVATEVLFNELSDEQIRDYIQTKKPLDKAGAYGIQDECGLVKKIVGSYDNVMGLPTEDIAKHVKR
jgi:septum formation protein